MNLARKTLLSTIQIVSPEKVTLADVTIRDGSLEVDGSASSNDSLFELNVQRCSIAGTIFLRHLVTSASVSTRVTKTIAVKNMALLAGATLQLEYLELLSMIVDSHRIHINQIALEDNVRVSVSHCNIQAPLSEENLIPFAVAWSALTHNKETSNSTNGKPFVLATFNNTVTAFDFSSRSKAKTGGILFDTDVSLTSGSLNVRDNKIQLSGTNSAMRYLFLLQGTYIDVLFNIDLDNSFRPEGVVLIAPTSAVLFPGTNLHFHDARLHIVTVKNLLLTSSLVLFRNVVQVNAFLISNVTLTNSTNMNVDEGSFDHFTASSLTVNSSSGLIIQRIQSYSMLTQSKVTLQGFFHKRPISSSCR